MEYGPYFRKGKAHAGFTTRECICDIGAELICPHIWAKAFAELQLRSAEGMTASEFNNKLQQCCSSCLSARELDYVRDWTSHAFRRGGAVDILQTKGMEEMLQFGEWASVRSASSYATPDEISSQVLRMASAAIIDLSEDED